MRVSFLFTALAILLGVGCHSQKPYLSVLGVSEAQRQEQVLVMVEVHNPTASTLRLARLDYQLHHPGSKETTRGKVPLHQSIAPGHSKVIDIPVPLEQATEYEIEGRLSGFAGDVAVSF